MISKLTKIPELLKHKREEEQQQEKKRKKQKQRNSRYIVDEVTISQAAKAHLEVDVPFKPPEVPEIIKEKDEGKGGNLDLMV